MTKLIINIPTKPTDTIISIKADKESIDNWIENNQYKFKGVTIEKDNDTISLYFDNFEQSFKSFWVSTVESIEQRAMPFSEGEKALKNSINNHD